MNIKNIMLLIFLIMLIIGCPAPIQEYNIKKFYGADVTKFVSQQVFPVPTVPNNIVLSDISFNIGNGESGNTPAVDHANGVFYKENAHSYDNIVHELDLGYLTGNTTALVYLRIKVVDHGYNNIINDYDDEAGLVYIKGKNSQESWQAVHPTFNNYDAGVLVLTNDEGKIEWYHDHFFPYFANPTCQPGYEIFKWEQIQIHCVWLVPGIIVE